MGLIFLELRLKESLRSLAARAQARGGYAARSAAGPSARFVLPSSPPRPPAAPPDSPAPPCAARLFVLARPALRSASRALPAPARRPPHPRPAPSPRAAPGGASLRGRPPRASSRVSGPTRTSLGEAGRQPERDRRRSSLAAAARRRGP